MIERWSSGLADDNMPESILVELQHLIRRHPWWHARASLVLKLLLGEGVRPPASVADVGCGWGVTLERLERAGYSAVGADISPRTLAMLDTPTRRLVELDLTQALPAGHATFDAVLALDVIEHIDDDRSAVARLAELVNPGGLLVVSVPALPELFSEFDAIQGHRRRYTETTLVSAFEDTGFDTPRPLWWGAWMVPLLSRRRTTPPAQSSANSASTYAHYLRLPPFPGPLVMQALYRLEEPKALRGDLRRGTSLFAVTRRPSR